MKDLANGGPEVPLSTHHRAYLLKCQELPFYRCAFFHSEVDNPAQGFLQRCGIRLVSVGISLDGMHVIDSREKHVLLGRGFQELSWTTRPTRRRKPHCGWSSTRTVKVPLSISCSRSTPSRRD